MNGLPSPDDLLRNRKAPANGPATYEEELDARVAREAAYRASLAKPDEAASANRIARARGIPSPVVRGNLAAFEQQERARAFADLVKRNPAISRWGSDVRNLEVGADDAAALGKVATGMDWSKNPYSIKAPPKAEAGVWGFLKGVYESFRTSMVGAEEQFKSNLPKPSFVSPESWRYAEQQGQKRLEMAIQRSGEAAPDFESSTMQGLYSGASSLAIMAPGIALSVATRNTAPGLASAGLLSETQAYAKYRARGATNVEANVGGMAEGAIEVATELLPLGVIVDRYGTTSVKRWITEYLIKEGLGEQAATHAQDAVDTIIANPDKTWGEFFAERPDAAYQTALATLVSGTVIGGTSEGSRIYTARKMEAEAAEKAAAQIDGLMEASASSKTRGRDPEAFMALIAEMAEDGGVDRLYVPAEAVQSYMQSEGYGGEFDSFRGAVDEGLATGGDVVIPIDVAAAQIAGTPAWSAIREDARITPGGMSMREAQAFNEAAADIMADLAERMDSDLAQQRAELEPRLKLVESVAAKLQDAGFTPHTARQQAELLAQRAATRSARMGQELTGQEYDTLAVNQVLPERLAAAQKADGLDFVINAMKRKADVNAKPGVSLLEFISEKGGVADPGGDLASMGAQDWHKGKAFKKKLVRDDGRTLDDLAMAAFEAGYFPGLTDRPTINDLLDAMGRELGGTPVFANFASEDAANADAAQADLVKATDELRSLLAEAGIDPDTATAREIKAAVAQYAEGQAQGQQFDQSRSDGPLGRITFPAQGYGRGKTVIDLFQSRNQSTFSHEMGHLWLEELRFDASDPNAPEQLKADWQAVQDWFAANGHPLQDGVIPVEAHEMWARGVERFLMEGKAPVPALRRIFEAVKTWFVQVYRTADRLNAPITDDIRAVMDRLIATDAEIAEAKQAQAIEAAFTEKPATMSDEEWAGYQELVQGSRDDAQSTMLGKVMSAVKRRVTKEYNEQKAAVREEVKAEIDSRPEFRALRQLRETPIDQASIADIYGGDALAMLPKQVPPVYKANGANPNDVAELSGFASADEMVRTLMGVETRRRELREGGDRRSVREVMIAQETDARMLERYGDPFTDGSIEEEALAAIHNDKAGEVMAAELRVLSRGTRNRPTPYSVAKAWAAKTIREGLVRDTTSRAAIQRYRRAAAKAGAAAQEAILSGDADAAFQNKQAQMLNNALLAEASRVAEEVDSAVKRLSNWAKRKTIKSVDQDYLERAQSLLSAVEMRPRSQRSLDKQAGFEKWADEQEALGHDIVVPASFAASLGSTHWSRLSVDQFLGLDAAVTQIIHLGRYKQTLLDGKEARDREELIREAEGGWGDGERTPPPTDMLDPSWRDKMKAGVLSIDAAMLKPETMVDWLDKGNQNGVFNRVVFRPIAEAEGRERAMLDDYYGRIRKAFEKVPQETLKRWQQDATFEELRTAKASGKMRRDRLIMMALNMGNAGNIQRLTDGYSWNEQTVRDVLNRELTAEDWRFIQEVWDIIDGLWPEAAALERRVNGVEPDKVEAVPFDTPYGRFNGGYFPAVYDGTRDYQAERNAGKESDLFDAMFTRATTRASSTKERAEAVKRPILLDLGVINRHIGEVVHDITHREAIMNADRFLSHPRIQRLMDEVLNPEMRKQFRPWLKFVANQWAMERSGNEALGKFLGKMRAHTTIVGMGFRISTIMTQMAGYSNSFEYVGAKWVAPAIAAAAKNPIETGRFVLERSPEVRARLDTLDRDINATMQEMAKSDRGANALTAAKRFAFHGIGYMDRVVVIPTWLGAYNKALAAGKLEADAIYDADKAVRLSQGTSSAKDMAAIQRGTGKYGEILKALTMFYTYMSAFYQRQRTLGRDVKRANAEDLPGLMARAWWLIAVPPVLAGLLSGNGPEEEEDWGTWAFKEMLFSSLGPIPIVRDAARPLWDKVAGNRSFDYQLSPIQRSVQTVINAAGDMSKVAQGEETTRATRNTLEAIGYMTGLVPGQVASSAQFFVDISQGEADPQTLSEWYEGITKGRIKDD